MTTAKKIVIWCGDAPNQKALANKIAAQFPVAGIVIDKKKSIRKTPLLQKLVTALQDRFFFRVINDAWTSLQQKYRSSYSHWPATSLLEVDSINSEEALRLTLDMAPDLVVVSGTGLVRKKMFAVKPSIGIINLHTGLSPYVKGGPNCTNWCISTGEMDKIGNTIMWLNEGIDSGNIIASECTALGNAVSLDDMQWKVMEHAHDLYLRTIHYLFNTGTPYQTVPQDQITKGKLYLTRMWNYTAKKNLLKNLSRLQRQGRVAINDTGTPPVTVPLGNEQR
ncbi:MAG: hypothetical protein JNK14_10945 [Chitinophagaceae bacterium]|nr:hypothetical protein [Chitinophagaceae bacterium]